MKPAIVLLVLACFAHGALAGEDSTHRWHGVGPAWYEVEGGLRRFVAGEDYDPVLGAKRDARSATIYRGRASPPPRKPDQRLP